MVAVVRFYMLKFLCEITAAISRKGAQMLATHAATVSRERIARAQALQIDAEDTSKLDDAVIRASFEVLDSPPAMDDSQKK